MKILCLLLTLANISLFIWEYRNGAFTDSKTTSEQSNIVGKEPILLASEMKAAPQPASPETNQNLPLEENNSVEDSAGQSEPDLNVVPATPETDPSETSNSQFP